MSEVIYRTGPEATEIFPDEERKKRGIRERVNHLTPAVNIHDSFQEPMIQQGHVHTAGYEVILLLWGDIDALTWDEKGVNVYPLREKDDLIIFLPGTSHTLIVNAESRVVVVKDFLPSSVREQRQRVELPASIESLREAVLKGEKPIEQALEEARTKLKSP